MVDPVFMTAEVISTGVTTKHGPYEREMITKWIKHNVDEMSSEQFINHKIVEA